MSATPSASSAIGTDADSSRARILIVGDAVAPTGYARVLRAMFQPLTARYSLHQLATRYNGGPHDYPWPLHSAADYGDPYGLPKLPELIDRLRPDILFLLYDLRFQDKYLARIRAASCKPAVVIYSPIESGPIEPEVFDRLHGVSRYVVFTEYARQLVLESGSSVHRVSPVDFPVPDVIPHGIDTGLFRPLAAAHGDCDEARRSARLQLGLEGGEFDDAFIVLNANRNLLKKRMDLTIEGFAQFARDKPANVKLYLHTQIQETGWHVVMLARRYGILDRLILSTAQDDAPDVSNEKLNLIYNACDVGVNTSINEGWGLVSFEHAATRRAQIVPGTPLLKQLWQQAALIIEPRATLTDPGTLTHTYLASPGELCRALERLYSDAQFRDEMAERSWQHATQPKLAWPTICEQWDLLLREVVEKHSPG